MSIINIWAFGPNPESEAIEQARALGYRDPVVARSVLVEGSRANFLAVIVAEGKEEAERHRRANKRTATLKLKREKQNEDGRKRPAAPRRRRTARRP